MSKRNLKGIEYFRIAAAFLVVAIHTSPLASYIRDGGLYRHPRHRARGRAVFLHGDRLFRLAA